MMKTDFSDKLIFAIKIIFFVLLGAGFAGLLWFNAVDHSSPFQYEDPVYIDEWTVEDPEGRVCKAGRSYRNEELLQGTFIITGRLPESVREDAFFCFMTGRDVEVYVNGELRKDFISKRDVIIPGGSVKRFYLLVPISGADAGAEVKIIRTVSTRRGLIYQETFVASDIDLFAFFMRHHGLSLILAGILMIFSLVIVIISAAMRVFYGRRIAMLYGALGIFVISVWSITNSYMYPFIFGHYYIDGILNYMCCLCMPLNLIIYMDALQHGRHRKFMLGLLCLTLVNMLFWSVLHFTGILSFANSLLYIDIILGLQVVCFMGNLIIETVRGGVREYRYTAIGVAGFLICSLSEIAILTFWPIMNDELPMLVGLAFLLTLTVIQQIDDLKRINDERQEAIDLSMAKTRFLASMSHEIRTPINAVLGMNEMILRENRDPVIADYARSVRSSGKMLLMLVNDVLDFSRIEAGKMEITNAAFKLSDLLHEILPMLKERADEKSLDLKIVIFGEVPDRLISDEFRIRQMLINLINNAIKYTDKGCVTLIVSGQYEEDDSFLLKFSIRDTGRGISEEDQKHLFEAFSRADIKKNRNIEGTGLGLAIVKSIIDSMGGTIEVTSKYGEGSKFTLTLTAGVVDREPVRDDFLNPEREESAGPVDEGGDYLAKDAKVLAVDDTDMNLRIVSLFLKHVGIVPDQCNSGRKALAMCREKKYDLLLLDHMMPEMDGIETLRRIRSSEDSKNKDTVAIVLTANALSGSRSLYMEAGFADYLTKPIASDVLEQTVRKYLPPEKVVSAERNEEMIRSE
ncbi:MAG: response regulator [Lachnospiraceae bacterium]|nr:response regulator [Lachnospiraceae bacterium]